MSASPSSPAPSDPVPPDAMPSPATPLYPASSSAQPRPLSRRRGLRAAAAAVLAVPTAATVTAAARAAPGGGDGRRLRTMSFNLRYASDEPPNSWSQRRPVMRALLRREAPHLIGTQEGLYAQLRDIDADLGPHYTWIGTGREGGSRDEFMAVYYDTRRLAPVEYDHFWLSDEPYLIGSNTWGAHVPRMVTWVRFRDLLTGDQLYLLNTHLDHVSQYARERSATLLTDRLRGLDSAVPRIVTGDFNVPAHGNPVYDTLLERGGLTDSWDTAKRRGRQYATFHGYGPLIPDGERIDWILTSPGVRTHYAEINTFAQDGQFPSDHLPVQAVLEL